MLALTAMSTGCGDHPSEGHALNEGMYGGRYPPGYTVGQRLIDASGGIGNTSDTTLELISIKPVYASGASVASVYRVAIMLPVKVHNGTVSGARFLLWPPALNYSEREGCVKPRLVPVKGFIVKPGSDQQIALFIHVRKLGSWHVKGERVTYRQGGQTYEQVVHMHTSSRARRGSPDKPQWVERQCHGRLLTEVPRAPLSETGEEASTSSSR